MMNELPTTATRRHRWLTGLGLLSAGSISAFFLMLSWLAGGDPFMRTLYGHEALVVAIAAALLGGMLALGNRELSRVAHA